MVLNKILLVLSVLIIVLSVAYQLTINSIEFKVHEPSVNKIILVTGTSTGIGRDAAVEFARLGYKVYGTIRKEEHGKEFQKLSKNLHPLVMDVTDTGSIEAAFKMIKRQVDNDGAQFVGLINNAGVYSTQLAECIDEKEMHEVFNVNVFGLMITTKTFLPLIRQSKGRIVNIGSLAGVVTFTTSPIYTPTKAAIEGYTDGLRRELLDLGVSVSLIEPGMVQSALAHKGITEDSYFDSKAIPGEVAKAYEALLERRQRLVVKAGNNMESPMESTVPAIVDAMMNKHPKTRYLVTGLDGIPAWFLAALNHVLPDRLMDHLLCSF